MNTARPARPGAASLALLLILVITAAWWALALWPTGGVEPEWLLRTRAACFGSMPGGLPDAGGWIVLVGEPIGMLGALLLVWGGALRDDLRRLRTDRRWQPVLAVLTVTILLALAAAGRRVAFATGIGTTPPPPPPGTPVTVDIDASAFVLTDQHGRRTSLADTRSGPALLTFAFGHCATVCPTIVHDLRAARAAAHRPEVPLLIISLDPWRDTPAQLPAIASEWALGPEDRLLSGSIGEIERTLDALGVRRRRDPATGTVDHSGTVMVVDDRGHIIRRLDGGWGGTQQLLAAMPLSGRR